MADESIADQVDSVVSLNDGESPMSVRQAANALAQHRYKEDAQERREQEQAAPAEAAAVEDRGSEEPLTAAPPQEATGDETTATIDQGENPPLDLPRSWAKDKSDVWAKLDRAAQEYLLEHDSKASAEVRRTQNETAEQRKALDAERQQLEQVRTQYEQALPMFLQSLQEQQAGQFADIRTMADVERMAREDWPRYALWDAHQKKVAAISGEIQAGQARQAQEYQAQWARFAQEQDAKFLEAAPEMKDATKATKISEAGVNLLRDLGFTQDELARVWNGQASVSLRDARMQLLIRDAIRYREARAAVPKAAAKTVPNVQRPGSPALHAKDSDVRISNLEKRVDITGNWKDAAELLIARRQARR